MPLFHTSRSRRGTAPTPTTSTYDGPSYGGTSLFDLSWHQHALSFLGDVGKISLASAGFVAALYVWKDARGPLHSLTNLKEAATDLRYYYDRDHPDNIKKRCWSIAGVAVAGIGYLICNQMRRNGVQRIIGCTKGCVVALETGVTMKALTLATRQVFSRHFFNTQTALGDIGTAAAVVATLFAGVIATKMCFPSERRILSDESTDSEEDEEDPFNALSNRSIYTDNAANGSSNNLLNVVRTPSILRDRQKAVNRDLYKFRRRRRVWQILRNLVFAPFVEEVIFRAVMWRILKDSDIPYPWWAKYFILAAGFSLAHAHHVMLHAIRAYQQDFDPITDDATLRKAAWHFGFRVTGNQLIMTAVFTYLNTFIYTKAANENILAATIAHCLCNYLGPPSLSYLHFRAPASLSREQTLETPLRQSPTTSHLGSPNTVKTIEFPPTPLKSTVEASNTSSSSLRAVKKSQCADTELPSSPPLGVPFTTKALSFLKRVYCCLSPSLMPHELKKKFISSAYISGIVGFFVSVYLLRGGRRKRF